MTRWQTLLVLMTYILVMGSQLATAVPLSQMPAKLNAIGVYIGTFDPLTLTHEGLIRAALASGKIDAVVVIANQNPRHKPNASSASDRRKMVELRFQNDENVFYPDLDVDSDPRSIIGFLRHKFKEAELWKIAGADTMQSLWTNSIDFMWLGKFDGILASARGLGDRGHPDSMLGQRIVPLDRDRSLNGPSSTDVRGQFARGEDTQALSPEVKRYVLSRGLYGSGGCADLLGGSRRED